MTVDDEAKHESLMGDINMAAGLSQKQITSRIYNRLKSLEYQLSKAGVNTVYQSARRKCTGTRSHGVLVFFEGDGITFPHWQGDGGFNISYSHGNMSNGESVITARIYTVLNGVHRTFGWTEKDGSFEQGLNFIKQNFTTGGTDVHALETRTDAAGCDGSGRDKAQRDTRTPGSEQDAASASGIR